MAITQLGIVKSLPYLFSNIMALPTCLPMAVGIIVFGKQYRIFFENKMLKIIGTLSYEIYLVHAFTLNIIKPGVLPIGKFIIITLVVAGILHTIIEERKNDRFNSRNFNKK